jgi:hypothetical protein
MTGLRRDEFEGLLAERAVIVDGFEPRMQRPRKPTGRVVAVAGLGNCPMAGRFPVICVSGGRGSHLPYSGV